jgi:hypothetical protein
MVRSIVFRRSALKRHLPHIGDPDTDNLYTGDHLSLHHCEAFVDEASDHGAIESVGKDKQLLSDAVRKVGK